MMCYVPSPAQFSTGPHGDQFFPSSVGPIVITGDNLIFVGSNDINDGVVGGSSSTHQHHSFSIHTLPHHHCSPSSPSSSPGTVA